MKEFFIKNYVAYIMSHGLEKSLKIARKKAEKAYLNFSNYANRLYDYELSKSVSTIPDECKGVG